MLCTLACTRVALACLLACCAGRPAHRGMPQRWRCCGASALSAVRLTNTRRLQAQRKWRSFYALVVILVGQQFRYARQLRASLV